MKKIFAFAAAMTFAVAVLSCGQKPAEQPVEETPAVEAPAATDSAAATTDSTAVAADSTAAK